MTTEASAEGRVLPYPNSATRPFWEATARGELVVQWCPHCERAQFHPGPLCRTCGGEPEWKTCTGRGTVYTYSIVRQSHSRPFRDLVPYVVAMIDLDEGVRMMTNIVDCPVDEVRIGMPVEVVFAEAVDDIALPFWRPVRSG